MKHLFIVNPVAGGKKNRVGEKMETIQQYMDTLQEEYEIYVTKAPLDATEKIRAEAQKTEHLRVYACGGDGTMNECVNGAAGLPHVAVTHYPCGTGNDFIRMFGEEAALFHSLDELVHGPERAIDLIDCNGRYSVNICSTGFDARTGSDVHKYSRIPVIGGAFGYVISLLVNLCKGVNEQMRITMGGRTLVGEFALVCLCNGRFYGGGFHPMPEALPDDGRMDTIVIRRVSRLQFIALVGKYAKGRVRELHDFARVGACTEAVIESDHDLVLNVDGEIMKSRRAEIRLVPEAVRLIVPKNMRNFPFSRKQEPVKA